ncbi:hypothetical protein ACFS07_30150 [Undibacterium arcticum]
MLAASFNRPGHAVIDHHTYVFMGDGCLMEGISHEVCSLAGTLGLGKLIGFYDDNGISIDGDVKGWFNDDTPKRFAAYGWNVIAAVDGHDVEALDAAIRQAKSQHSRPTLICCKTAIGQGAPTKAGDHDVHGAPLGTQEIAAMRAQKKAGPLHRLRCRPRWRRRGTRATPAVPFRPNGKRVFAAYRAAFPALGAELARRIAGILPAALSAQFAQLINTAGELHKKVATRKASQIVLEHITSILPEFFSVARPIYPAPT